jgi:hypothetical protein
MGPQLWAAIPDTEASLDRRWFRVYGTGEPIDAPLGIYLGTFQMPPCVWHLFEVVE